MKQCDSVGLCASGVALRYDYRPMRFTSKDTIEPGMDTIMVGLDSDIRRWLSPFNLLEKGWGITGPHLEIAALPLVSMPATMEKSPAVGEEETTDPKGLVKKRRAIIPRSNPQFDSCHGTNLG